MYNLYKYTLFWTYDILKEKGVKLFNKSMCWIYSLEPCVVTVKCKFRISRENANVQ